MSSLTWARVRSWYAIRVSSLTWARVRSWHAIRTFRRDGAVETYCGRVLGSLEDPAPTVQELPSGKSCETCLRIVARAADVD